MGIELWLLLLVLFIPLLLILIASLAVALGGLTQFNRDFYRNVRYVALIILIAGLITWLLWITLNSQHFL